MNTVMKRLTDSMLLIGAMLAMSQTAYAAVAGHVQFVYGNVQITSAAGQTHQAQKGDAVSEGDMLTSALGASAQIKMQDGGFVAVRSDTRMKFDQFVFAGKQDGSEKSFFSLFKGGFRAVTGLIGMINKPNYRITTPASTIGIRGTDHETFMITPDSFLAQVAPIGAYSKVNLGETIMTTDKGAINVLPNQMGFAGGMNQAPQLQPLNTDIFTVAAAPTAEAAVENKEDKKESGESGQDQSTAGNEGGDGKSEQATDEGGGSENSEQATAESGGGQDGEQSVRDSAVVDAVPPDEASIPTPTSSAIGDGVGDVTLFVPDIADFAPPETFAAGGQLINLTAQTIVSSAGAAAVPITGNNPVYAAQNGYGYEALGIDAGVAFNPWNSNLFGYDFLLDAGNNLVEVTGGMPSAGVVAGGVAKDTYVAADGSVYLGRWEGGSYTDTLTMTPAALGNTSLQWIFSANPPLGYVQTLAGTTNYSLTAATHPTDQLGNVGILTAASLSANFTTQVVNISLALAFSAADPNFISTHNKAFTVSVANVPISLETIWAVGTPTVACTGANCDASYTADIWARFAANAADKVAIPYSIMGNVTDLVQGVAMVATANAPVVTTVAPAATVAAYVQNDRAVSFAQIAGNYLGYLAKTRAFLAAPADVVGVVPGTVTFVDRYSGKSLGSSRTFTLDSATAGEGTTSVGNGIQYGRYTSNTFAQEVVVGTTNMGLPAGTYRTDTPTLYTPIQMHWITGPAIDPVYLPEVLLTTNTYTFFGGTTPTSSFASASTLNSATLSVNFTQQLVSFALNLTVAGVPWIASSTNAQLDFYSLYSKSAFLADDTPLGTAFKNGGVLTLTVNGTPIAASAGSTVKGQLTGSGLNGALLSYFLNSGSDQVTGVAAFTGTPVTVPSYRLVALSAADPLPSANQFPGNVYPTGGANPNGPIPIPVTLGGYNNVSSVVMDAAGNLTQFRTSDANNINNNNMMYTFSKGAAVATGLGTDPVSGISWGRWDNASFTTTEVVSGAVVTSNNNVGSAHWIASPTLVGAVTLPVTGVFNYVLAGGTAPTDSLGGAGTLNSAGLSANFATQTVSVGLNVTTPNAGNLIASAANLPIEQKSFFNASTLNAVGGGSNPGSMTVTCGAGCVGTPEGHLGGAFAGAGGIGAAVLYGFSAGVTNTVIVNGAAAFHR